VSYLEPRQRPNEVLGPQRAVPPQPIIKTCRAIPLNLHASGSVYLFFSPYFFFLLAATQGGIVMALGLSPIQAACWCEWNAMERIECTQDGAALARACHLSVGLGMLLNFNAAYTICRTLHKSKCLPLVAIIETFSEPLLMCVPMCRCLLSRGNFSFWKFLGARTVFSIGRQWD